MELYPLVLWLTKGEMRSLGSLKGIVKNTYLGLIKVFDKQYIIQT